MRMRKPEEVMTSSSQPFELAWLTGFILPNLSTFHVREHAAVPRVRVDEKLSA